MTREQLNALLEEKKEVVYFEKGTEKKVKLTALEDHIWHRMKECGDFIHVGVGNMFWANENQKGVLTEALFSEEKDAIFSLEQKGLIEQISKN